MAGIPAAISPVGSAVTNSGAAASTASLSVSPGTVGNALLLVSCNNKVGTPLSALSGGGVSSWSKIAQYLDGTTNTTMEFWIGRVDTVGPSTITCSQPSRWSLLCQEFTCASVNPGTIWAADGASSGSLVTTASTTVQFPTLTPTGPADAYVGQCLAVSAPLLTGQTAGYSVVSMPPMVNYMAFMYNPAVSGAQSPFIKQTSSGAFQVLGVLVSATNPSSPGRLLPFFTF